MTRKTKPGSQFSVAAYKSLSKTTSQAQIVSTIEATGGAPIWGVQWHPERPQYEWKLAATDPFNHSEDAIMAMFAVAAFFVRQTRASPRAFADVRTEQRALIYNFEPVGPGSMQAYFFSPADDSSQRQARNGLK